MSHEGQGQTPPDRHRTDPPTSWPTHPFPTTPLPPGSGPEPPPSPFSPPPGPTSTSPVGTMPITTSPAGAPPSKGPRGSRRLQVALAALLVLVLAGGLVGYRLINGDRMEAAPDDVPTPTGKAAQLPAGRTWLSGAWTGGTMSAQRINEFGAWRGQAADVVTTYPARDTWDDIRNAEWYIGTFDGFPGRLSYGLPILPKDEQGGLEAVAGGQYDDVWTSTAQSLVKHGRGDSFVRIGLEANGTWFPWGATAVTADVYKAAWRRVQKVMKAQAPDLVFGFDITCGKPLEGGSHRMDSLTKLYPGDDVVDVIGCDHYDSYNVKSRNADEWKKTLRPGSGAGLADVADFTRSHGKKLAVPEWGLTTTDEDGAGDNPYFMYAMYGYFQQNKDILAYENYFNEDEAYLGSAIWSPAVNPKASQEYRKLWGAAPLVTRRS